MLVRALFSLAVSITACSSSMEGTYTGTARESINVPMETGPVGGSYGEVTVTPGEGDELSVQIGPSCRLRARGSGDTVSLGTWPADGQVCRFAVPDGRTFVPTVLTGSLTRTSSGISLRLQGSVANAADAQQTGSYSLSFDGRRR